MAKPPRHNTMPRLAAVAVTLTSGVMPAVASPVQDAYFAHTKACIGLLLSDPAAHAAQCLPNNSPNIPAHAGTGTIAVPVVVPAPVVLPPPPPPVVVPPPIVDSSYPEVDSSYPEVDSSYPEVDSSYPSA